VPEDPLSTVTAPARGLRSWLWQAVRLAAGLALAVVAVAIVLGRRQELAGTSNLIGRVRWEWIVLAVVLELCSLAAFAAVERTLLRAGGARIGIGPLGGIALAGNAIQNSLPGGVAWASVFAFRQFRRRGVDDVLAAWVIVAVGVVSLVSLALFAAVGVGVAGGEAASLDLVGAVAGVLGAGVVAAILLRRAGRSAAHILAAGIRRTQRVIHRPRGDAHALAHRIWSRLTAVAPDNGEWAIAGVFSLANWIFDCACLALAFEAVRAPLPLRGVVLAYGAGQLAAILPITPGGLGVVEGSLAIALVAYGENGTTAVAAVLVYRMISFWLLLPVGWAAWAALTVRARRRAGDRS
jgi:uncharacterized protein (TIRG00374 family)